MSNSDVAQYLQVLVQLGVLTATIYFYRQLVANDNQREVRAQIEERERKNATIKTWCKNAFRNAGNSGGMLQSAGQTLRRKYPESVSVILEAYGELCNEAPELRMPPPYKFLEYMDGVERGSWPRSIDYRLGRNPDNAETAND